MLSNTARLAGAAAAFAAASAALAQPEYEVTFLGLLPDTFSIIPTAISDEGLVVGFGQFRTSPQLRAIMWTEAEGLTLIPPPPGVTNNYTATGINSEGVIVGGVGNAEGWRLKDGQYTRLGTLGGYPISEPGAINEAGAIVGTTEDFMIGTVDFGFLWTEATGIMDIRPGAGSRGVSINEHGQIAGTTDSTGSYGQPFVREPDGTILILDPGDPERPSRAARAINDSGQVVFWAARVFGADSRVTYLFTPGEGHQRIEGPCCGRQTPVSIANDGAILGNRTDGTYAAWLYTPENGARLLNDLIDPSFVLNITTGMQMNNRRQIIATSHGAPQDGAVLLTPVDSGCYADCDASGELDFFDFLCFQNQFAAGDPEADCDVSGELDFFDFLCFQDEFAAGCP
jgi:uncharacterized membrane protein